MTKIHCTTLFDITATGVRRQFKESRVPFVDHQGEKLTDQDKWTKSRNKQRNWETINQIISLRSLTENITSPVRHHDRWQFSFEIENPATVALGSDPVGAVLADCEGVPMITGLDEIPLSCSWFVTHGDQTNIWFQIESHK